MTASSDQLQVRLFWLGEKPMLPGRSYELVCGDQQTNATITRLKYLISTETANPIKSQSLSIGETGICNLSLSSTIVFDSHDIDTETASFQLRDSNDGTELARGYIDYGLRRADNIHWQPLEINKQLRAKSKSQKPCVIWLTGLSGSGKSTIANQVEKRLFAQGNHSYLLDGDNVRLGLNRDLGFTEADRIENIRRVAETARLMVDAGLIVVTSFISPFRAERTMARDLFDTGEFIEVFIDTPLKECELRDPKGLYKKARAGEIKNFTGLDSPYEAPENPEIIVTTTNCTEVEAANQILQFLEQYQ